MAPDVVQYIACYTAWPPNHCGVAAPRIIARLSHKTYLLNG